MKSRLALQHLERTTAEWLMFVDADDSVFAWHPRVALHRLTADAIIAADRKHWPLDTPVGSSGGIYPYGNSGGVLGHRDALRELYREAVRHRSAQNKQDDQYGVRVAADKLGIQVDTQARIFQTLSWTKPGELQWFRPEVPPDAQEIRAAGAAAIVYDLGKGRVRKEYRAHKQRFPEDHPTLYGPPSTGQIRRFRREVRILERLKPLLGFPRMLDYDSRQLTITMEDAGRSVTEVGWPSHSQAQAKRLRKSLHGQGLSYDPNPNNFVTKDGCLTLVDFEGTGSDQPMLGLCTAIGGDWPEAGRRAAARVEQATRIPCRTIEQWPDGLQDEHPARLRLYLQRLYPEHDLLIFDADFWPVCPWYPSALARNVQFMAVRESSSPGLERQCRQFGIDSDRYFNGGLLWLRRGCRLFERALEEPAGKMGDWWEQNQMNRAAQRMRLRMRLLPSKYNRLLPSSKLLSKNPGGPWKGRDFQTAKLADFPDAINLHFVGSYGDARVVLEAQDRFREWKERPCECG